MDTALILGSGPNAPLARAWPRGTFGRIVTINNAHMIRPDWDECIFPWDFPQDRRPLPAAGQRLVTEADFVPAQNAFGGFVYGGGTMAFTAAYWVLHAHAPRVIGFMGCDMHYPRQGRTHFYGQGTPDPLREDITLQSLEAKSARAMVLAAMRGIAMVNLSDGPTRLVFPRVRADRMDRAAPAPFDDTAADRALRRETELGYVVPSGRYWEDLGRFSAVELRRVDEMWLKAAAPALRLAA